MSKTRKRTARQWAFVENGLPLDERLTRRDDRGGEPQNEPGLGPADDLLEAASRQMMTLVHDDLTVLRHAILDDALSYQALNDGHIERTGRFLVAASDASNRLGRQIEERRKPLDPLLQQLAAVYENQA